MPKLLFRRRCGLLPCGLARGSTDAALRKLDEEEDEECQEDEDEIDFAFPGTNSALRAATASDPRDLPCPTCEKPNRLTRQDRALGYQCDSCADRAEQGLEY